MATSISQYLRHKSRPKLSHGENMAVVDEFCKMGRIIKEIQYKVAQNLMIPMLTTILEI